MDYSIKNNEIFADGEKIATKTEDGAIQYLPGMKSRHAANLKVWLAGGTPETVETSAVVKENLTTETVETAMAEAEVTDNWRDHIGDWKFDKIRGVETPEFIIFCQKWNLTEDEKLELIKIKTKSLW